MSGLDFYFHYYSYYFHLIIPLVSINQIKDHPHKIMLLQESENPEIFVFGIPYIITTISNRNYRTGIPKDNPGKQTTSQQEN